MINIKNSESIGYQFSIETKHLAGEHDQMSHGGGGNIDSDVKSTVEKIGRKMPGNDPDPKWQAALVKADTRAITELKSAISDIKVQKISGDHVQEPRVEGFSASEFSAIKKTLREKGWQAPAMWNKPNSQTFKNKDGFQITVERPASWGEGGRKISYFPQYKLKDFDLD